MEADREVIVVEHRGSAEERRLRWFFSHPACLRAPAWVRGVAMLVLCPLFVLRELGLLAARRYASTPRVRVSRARIEVRDGASRVTVGVPTAFRMHALRGGGARVLATLDDASCVELPLPALTVAEADALSAELSAHVRDDARYR